MKLYHATDEASAVAIIRDGFMGGVAVGGLSVEPMVWFSDEPAPYGDTTICVEVPESIAVEHELEYLDQPDGISPGGQCEYVFPPETINHYPRAIIAD
jgi:hypothetical protein